MYTMKVKEGLDGSGRHSVYDQKRNVQTHNMIMWMWMALEVYKDDQISNANPSLPPVRKKVKRDANNHVKMQRAKMGTLSYC